ncbi:MAG: Xaa-Pro dipeptidase [Steroidobacteraceae bacterium]
MTDDLAALFARHVEALTIRTDGALAACGFDSLILHAGRAPPVCCEDQHYPLRALAPFRAWAPLQDAPDSIVCLSRGRRPRLVLCTPDDYWHKPPQRPQAYWTAAFDIDTAPTPDAVRAALPAGLGRTAIIGSPATELASWGVDAINPDALMLRLDFGRAVKSAYEIECLRRANRSGVAGHRAALAAFQAGASEFEIELAFLGACGLREQELPYNPIIALNEAGSVLHYQVLEKRPPTEVRSLLIDAGSEFAGYASDITRTWSREAGDFAALVSAMDTLQQRLCAAVAPGVDWRDIHLLAVREIASLLCEAGILRGSVEAAIDTGAVAAFFPHGIGHLLGLQVHDVGGLQAGPSGGTIGRPDGHPFLRLTRRLEPGFVVTMEPGLYFIDSLLERLRPTAGGKLVDWGRVTQLRPYGGIRIEDNLAITADGHENLTRQAFDAAT